MDTKTKEEGTRKARNIVFRLLKLRAHSKQELRDKLATHNLPAPIVEQTIKYFKDCKLINDDSFARQWISSRLKKPFGLNRIRVELKNKGIEEKIIKKAFNDALRNYDELTIVTRLAKHQAVKYTNTDLKKIKQRVYGYLLRRGFNEDTIAGAVKRI